MPAATARSIRTVMAMVVTLAVALMTLRMTFLRGDSAPCERETKKRTITLVWKRLRPGGERLAQPTNTFPPCNPTVPWPVRQRKAANFAFNPTQPLRTRNTDKTPHRPIGSRPIAKNIRESSRPLTAGMKIGDRPCFPAPFLETLAIILLSILDYFPARANDYDLGFFGNPVELHRAWIDVVRRRLARGGLEGLASKR